MLSRIVTVILVDGGSGLVGYRWWLRLLRAGLHVISPEDICTGTSTELQWQSARFEIVRHDRTDPIMLRVGRKHSSSVDVRNSATVELGTGLARTADYVRGRFVGARTQEKSLAPAERVGG